MKKFLLLVLMQLSMATAVAQQLHGPLIKNEEGYVLVRDAEALERAITFNCERIQLMADLYIPNLRQICGTFRGTITGKHKQYVEELGVEVDAMYSIDGGRGNGGKKTWLFDKVEGARFEYIHFKNFRVEEDIVNGGELGLIAKEAVNSVFSNLTFDSISVFEDDNYAGVIAGVASGCQFEYILTTSCDVTTDGRCAGGLVGSSTNGYFNTCFVFINCGVYADGSLGDSRAGGFVGESKGDNFEYCMNSGLVGGRSDELGGIVGRSKNSKFTGCENHFAVVFSHEEGDDDKHFYFKNILNDIRNRLNNLSPEEKASIESQLSSFFISAGGIAAGGVITAAATLLYLRFFHAFESLLWNPIPIILELSKKWTASTVTTTTDLSCYGLDMAYASMPFYTMATTVLGAIVINFIIEGIKYATSFHYVGGICGYAVDSEFERCTNNALLYCDSLYYGGIVGYTDGGSINNCLNTGKAVSQSSTLGGIVGCVVEQTKVTNCLSTQEYPIIGEYSGYSCGSAFIDVSKESGNNYRLKNNDKGNKFKAYEMQVDSATIADGSVALWLNDGIENRNLAVKPWRQNLNCEYSDVYPVLDMTHKEVTVSPEAVASCSAADEAQFAPRLCDECAASIDDAASDADSSGEAYDIMGHKVGCNHHGIIIINGKKVLNNH